MTELEKLEAGLEYSFTDPALHEQKHRALALCDKLNALPSGDTAGREAIVRELFGAAGEAPRVYSMFFCDSGSNIRVGDHFLANYNVTILDRAKVTIGNDVLLAPGVLITTVNHSFRREGRRAGLCTALPITIGNDVWIGGNATILPGVTIGDNVIVAAGAVVTKDVPSNSVVAGVPARFLREAD
ncbi:MAG: sugar O-acetyltransferase [Oscillospiraceae bacterium]|nr:sugar O-acetyltransferase [Oscillospiraceae bacterium]